MLDIIKTIFSSTDGRTQAVKRNVAGGVVLRGIGIVLGFIQVPLLISYVDKELYGIWLTMSSIVAWLSFFNIGLGSGLRNRLAECLALGKFKLGKIYVSTAYFLLSLIFISVALICFFVSSHIDWCELLNVDSAYHGTLVTLSRIVLISLCLQQVIGLIGCIYNSYQMTAVAGSFDTIGRILAIGTVYVLTFTTSPNINYLALAFCGLPILVQFIASLYMYSHKFKLVAPSINYIRPKFGGNLLNVGVQFFLIQIVTLILYSATNFIISHYCGATQVTVYNVAYSYIGVATMAYNILLNPIWSAYSDAFARRDYDWMKSIYRKLYKLSLIVFLGIALMVLLSPVAYRIWLNGRVTVPWAITIAVAIYTSLKVLSNMSANVLNGMNKIRVQLLQGAIQVIVYIPLVILLAPKYDIYGILVALIASAVIPAVVLPYQVRLLLNRKASGLWDK
ncbi:MAG: MATE family efflux transporter [Prevotellaceae bacterium]|nr:MATE family efflux transporter [Candidatus Faecinaster equi]